MSYNRHIAVWRIFAIHLNTNNKSLATFDRLCRDYRFLHDILPALGKALDRGLTGQFTLDPSLGFKRQKGSQLPAFLYEHFIKVFTKDGVVRDQPKGIGDLRQLLFLFYKFEMLFDDESQENAYSKFIATDADVKETSWPSGLDEVRKNFISLLPDNPRDIRPHHSGGVTADKVSNVLKRKKRRHIKTLNKVFDASFFFNSKHHAQIWASVNKTVTSTPCSRVTLVPKDSRGPRIICMEPHELMFVQKGLMSKIYDHIETCSPAKGYINFTDQSVNQKLAWKSSISRGLSTIDLKDASDMVSLNLVKMVSTPEWYDAFMASRSAEALVGGRQITFKKFAPMGSALCFPVEAMIFWSICRTISPKVWVYGDDIIVPSKYSTRVIKALETYGLVVNQDKTLTEGFFRESCGGEYYKGEDISYVKCKSYAMNRYVAFCNLIADRHGGELGEQLIKLHENETGKPVYREHISNRHVSSECVFYSTRTASRDVFFKRRYNDDYQCYEFRRPTATVVTEKIGEVIDDTDLLFDWFTNTCESVSPEYDAVMQRTMEGVDVSVHYRLSSHVARQNEQRSYQAKRRGTASRIHYTWGVGLYRLISS